MKSILLQCKFLLVEFLNISYQLVPNPLRNYYLRMFGIRIWGGKSCIHRGCKFFHVGKLSVGEDTVVNFGCYLDNRRGIYVGNNVGIAHNTKIYTLGHDLNDSSFATKGGTGQYRRQCFCLFQCSDNARSYNRCRCYCTGWKCCDKRCRTLDNSWRKSCKKNKRSQSWHRLQTSL